MTYTIKLDGGKYTVINDEQAGLSFLRHGEAWPAADDLKHSGVVLAMAQRIEELETAVRDVLDGTIYQGSERNPDGMNKFPYNSNGLVDAWLKRLDATLEQKP